MERDQMRAGDGDRQQVAAHLKQALDEGRLDLTEYDERLQRTYAARTYGDLNGLLDDLPGTIPVQRSQVQPAPPAPDPVKAAGHGQGIHGYAWAPGLGIFVVCTIIYLASSIGSGDGFGYFWPIWTIFPFIFGVFGQYAGGHSKRNRRR